jgi:hypothetical protein
MEILKIEISGLQIEFQPARVRADAIQPHLSVCRRLSSGSFQQAIYQGLV